MEANQVRDVVLKFISEYPTRSYNGDVLGAVDASQEERDRAVSFLMLNKYIKINGSTLGLDALGMVAMDAGGFIAYTERQRANEQHGRDVGDATIKGTVWSRNHGRINIGLTTIAIVISGYGISQSSKAEANIIHARKVSAMAAKNLEHAEQLIHAGKAERDSLRMELILVRALVDSVRTPIPVPVRPVRKSRKAK